MGRITYLGCIVVALFTLMLGGATILHEHMTEQFYRSLDAATQPEGNPLETESGVSPLASCPDACAWLVVSGTPISYPVVAARSSTEVDYYLNHRIDGLPSSAGSIVLDERSQAYGTHLVVYGHRMGWTDAMFGSLWNAYEPSSFADIGRAWWYTAENGWEAFDPLCSFTVSAQDANIQRFTFTTSAEVASFAQHLAQRSVARSATWEEQADRARRLLTLVTCTQPWVGTDMRTVVVFCSP